MCYNFKPWSPKVSLCKGILLTAENKNLQLLLCQYIHKRIYCTSSITKGTCACISTSLPPTTLVNTRQITGAPAASPPQYGRRRAAILDYWVSKLNSCNNCKWGAVMRWNRWPLICHWVITARQVWLRNGRGKEREREGDMTSSNWSRKRKWKLL